MIFKTVSVLIFCVAASGACAQTFLCKFDNRGGYASVIPAELLLSVDQAKGVGAAYDALIDHHHQVPIPVKFRKVSGRYVFDWTLKNLKTGNKSYHLSYTARLNPKNLRVTLRGDLHGFDNEIYGSGRCERVK